VSLGLKVVMGNYGEFANVILPYTMRSLLAPSQAEQLDASSFKAGRFIMRNFASRMRCLE